MGVSFIIPSYNNLKHLKNVYTSIKKHAPQAEVILLDDGSTDRTWEWIQEQDVVKFKSDIRVGHTVLYDRGIELATNEIVGILHADMILGPKYVENMLKHLKPGTVVCGTRIEPPLHPEGKEKIVKDFGQDSDTLNIPSFESFCLEVQTKEQNVTTKGMFAPWILYKKDFQAIGGHDPLFAPFPYEDSDIFQRWMLNGYEMVQSRDALVYHLTCRGHRWNDQVGKDDDYYKIASAKASRNYLRKWGSWIKNDEYQYPIVAPKYNIAYVVNHTISQHVEILEPWCDRLYIDDEMQVITSHYIDQEQPNTKFDLTKRILSIKYNDPIGQNDIVVEFDGRQLNGQNFQLLQQLPEIIKESGEIGTFELDIFKITINSLQTYEKELITLDSPHYLKQLL
jgi:glycosyltransferase involved in cell wall biosynthesis